MARLSAVLPQCRDKYVVAASVRVLRSFVGSRDDYYHRYMAKHRLFDHVVKLYGECGGRDTLVRSAVLEMFDYLTLVREGKGREEEWVMTSCVFMCAFILLMFMFMCVYVYVCLYVCLCSCS